MMLIGRVAKEEGPFWAAECEAIGAFTQGNSRAEAFEMLADLVETMINRPGFKASVAEIGKDGDEVVVYVSGSDPAVLAAQVLKYQREVHKLTLADVQKKLGASSINAYAAYEQGKREPSLSKYLELLGAVAPDMALMVAPKKRAKAARKERSDG